MSANGKKTSNSPTVAGATSDAPFNAAWEGHRGYLINIAYRLLGSLSEAEDMIQEGYVRLMRADRGDRFGG